jgi:octaprenyl-diphosphate synthase
VNDLPRLATESDTTGRGHDSLDALYTLVGQDLQGVNRVILERMQSPVSLIPQLAGHIVAGGYRGERHIPLAACVEFIHTATLLHDDVVDESDLRRGLATANALWGNKASVLVGDFLFSRAFQIMVADGSLEVLRILSNASAVIAEGEVGQLMTTNDLQTDEQAYLEVIRAKTGALFAAATRIGAVVAERPEAEERGLESYGLNLGIAFQLVDDVLDYSAQQAELGKTIGDDFRDGKITLPVVLAYARGDETERAFWHRCLEQQELGKGDLDHALALMLKRSALADALACAQSYGDEARAALKAFPDSEVKTILLGVIDFCLERAY